MAPIYLQVITIMKLRKELMGGSLITSIGSAVRTLHTNVRKVICLRMRQLCIF